MKKVLTLVVIASLYSSVNSMDYNPAGPGQLPPVDHLQDQPDSVSDATYAPNQFVDATVEIGSIKSLSWKRPAIQIGSPTINNYHYPKANPNAGYGLMLKIWQSKELTEAFMTMYANRLQKSLRVQKLD
ncbi:hypothetical protein Noda2021_12000 [Candidatus Dependentiae bacterium Noda2021]|nr:hypothetical protein Noda2021_12000 [Candidatus Dependentiae bacterium Noda2021]